MRSVIDVVCSGCGARFGIYADQLGKVSHWTCSRRVRGSVPPKYRKVQDVEVRA